MLDTDASATTLLKWVNLPQTPAIDCEMGTNDAGAVVPTQSRQVLGQLKNGTYLVCFYQVDPDEHTGSWRTACSECWEITPKWGLARWAALD